MATLNEPFSDLFSDLVKVKFTVLPPYQGTGGSYVMSSRLKALERNGTTCTSIGVLTY